MACGSRLRCWAIPVSRARVWLSERTLDRYIDHCNWVIVDESSVTLTMGGDSFVTRAYKQENLIVIRNLSEELGMPGIPLSYAIGHPDTIKLIRQFTDGTSIGMFHEIVAQQLPYLGDYQERTNTLIDKEIPWGTMHAQPHPGHSRVPLRS